MNAIVTKAGRREWAGLTVLVLPALLVSMDISVFFFALPRLTEELASCCGSWMSTASC
jgi:MFS transporter, DHA2 family, multidrug resistance protein